MKVKRVLSFLAVGAILSNSLIGCGKSEDSDVSGGLQHLSAEQKKR